MLFGLTSASEIGSEVALASYTSKLNSLSHLVHKQKAIRNSLNHYRLKQSQVLTLKHDGIQYSCYYSSEVVDLSSHARSLTAEIVLRVEI